MSDSALRPEKWMVRTFFVAAVAVMVGAFAMAAYTSLATPTISETDKYYGTSITIWRDPDTGCHYLITRRSGGRGITPRLDMSGKQVCVP